MTDNTTEQPKKSRRWRRWLLLLGGIVALVITQHLLRGPQLHPVTRRQLSPGCEVRFALEGCGYPVLQSTRRRAPVSAFSSAGPDDVPAVLLDARCRPLPAPIVSYDATRFSPTGRLCAWLDDLPPRPIVRWHAGFRQDRALRESDLFEPRRWPSYNMFSVLTDQQVIYTVPGESYLLPYDAPQAVRLGGTPSGGAHYRWVKLPPAGIGYRWTFHPHVSLDARYLVMRKITPGYQLVNGELQLKSMPEDTTLYLYDLQRQRITRHIPTTAAWRSLAGSEFMYARSGFIWLLLPEELPVIVNGQGERLVAVPAIGKALVADPGKPVTAIGKGDTCWRVGEDGTVWCANGRAVQVLHWRQGRPDLVTIAQTARTPDTRFVDVANNRNINVLPMGPGTPTLPPSPIWAAVWHDGAYTAMTETVTLLPDALAEQLDRGRRLLGWKSPLPRQARRLTLYHQGTRRGRYTVPITSPAGPPLPSYTEHLAFTRDGHHLSWVINTGHGPLILAFKVQ